MKKQILLIIGVAGAFAAQPVAESRADVRIGINIPGGPGIYFDSRPDFVYMDDYGFAVSYGGPHDVIYYGNAYFVFRDGYWFRAYDYRGPWGRISNFELPGPIRRHGWDDIRRHRDIEYRRHDRGFWEDRFRRDRDHWRQFDDRRAPDYRRGPDDRRGPADRRWEEERRGPAGPPPPPERREPARPQEPSRMGPSFGRPGPSEQHGPAAPQQPVEHRNDQRPNDRDERQGPGDGSYDRQNRR